MSPQEADPPPGEPSSETSGEPPAEDPHAWFGLKRLVRDILGIDRGALAILVTVPIALTLLDYYGMPWHYGEGRTASERSHRPGIGRHLPPGSPRDRDGNAAIVHRAQAPLEAQVRKIELFGPERVRKWVWWGIACMAFLVLIPMAVAWLLARQSPRALGLRLKGTGRDAWTYLALFVIFWPVIYLVSTRPDFQNTYPFYRPSGSVTGWDFILFELVYCSQFFAVEFFFRGFIVLGLKRHIGKAAILVMLAPYCMIHYYKPMPEAFGAIGAGLVLGTLAWRTETILYGWALHYGVALSMDLLALHQIGLL